MEIRKNTKIDVSLENLNIFEFNGSLYLEDQETEQVYELVKCNEEV